MQRVSASLDGTREENRRVLNLDSAFAGMAKKDCRAMLQNDHPSLKLRRTSNMEQQYLESLQSFYKKNKRLPSYSEMLTLFGLASKNAIHKIVKKFTEAGYLDKLSGKLAPGSKFFQIPLLGNVKAGFPTGAEEDLNFMSLDEYLVDKPGSSFMLKVAGDSLEGIGIFKGDMVILEKSKDAPRGAIVLALIDNEWTLKIIEKVNGETVLRSANPKYPDFYPHLSLEIFGVVKSVIRKY